MKVGDIEGAAQQSQESLLSAQGSDVDMASQGHLLRRRQDIESCKWNRDVAGTVSAQRNNQILSLGVHGKTPFRLAQEPASHFWQKLDPRRAWICKDLPPCLAQNQEVIRQETMPCLQELGGKSGFTKAAVSQKGHSFPFNDYRRRVHWLYAVLHQSKRQGLSQKVYAELLLIHAGEPITID